MNTATIYSYPRHVRCAAILALTSLFAGRAQAQEAPNSTEVPGASALRRTSKFDQDPSRTPYIAELTSVDFIAEDGTPLRKVAIRSGSGDPTLPLIRLVHDPIGATVKVDNITEKAVPVAMANSPTESGEYTFVEFDDTILLSSQSFREVCAPRAVIENTNLAPQSFRVDLIPFTDGMVVYSRDGEVVAVVDLPMDVLKNNTDRVTLRRVQIPGTLKEIGDLHSALSREVIVDSATCKAIRAVTNYNLYAGVIESVISKYESAMGGRGKLRSLEQLGVQKKAQLLSEIQRSISVVTTATTPGQYVVPTFAATQELEGMISTFIAERNKVLDISAGVSSPAVEAAGASSGQATQNTSTDQGADSTRTDTKRERETTTVDTNTEQTTNSIGADAGFGIGPFSFGVSASHSNTNTSSHQHGERELSGTATSNSRMRGFVYTRAVMSGRDILAVTSLDNIGRSVLTGIFLKNIQITDMKQTRFMSGRASFSFTREMVQTLDDQLEEIDVLKAGLLGTKPQAQAKLGTLLDRRTKLTQLTAALEGRIDLGTPMDKDPDYDLLFLEEGRRVRRDAVERYYAAKGVDIDSIAPVHELAYLRDLHQRTIALLASDGAAEEAVKQQLKNKLREAQALLRQSSEDADVRRKQVLVRQFMNSLHN